MCRDGPETFTVLRHRKTERKLLGYFLHRAEAFLDPNRDPKLGTKLKAFRFAWYGSTISRVAIFVSVSSSCMREQPYRHASGRPPPDRGL